MRPDLDKEAQAHALQVGKEDVPQISNNAFANARKGFRRLKGDQPLQPIRPCY
jgi:hypothetical protein